MIHALVDPLAALGYAVNELLHNIAMILDHVLVHSQHTRNEIWPHVFCQPQDARVTGEICFLQFWPAIKTKWLKKAVACYLFVNEIGNRTGEMTCDRQKSDSKFLFIAGRGVF